LGPSPAAVLSFERELAEPLREIGRVVTEFAYNRLEGEQPEELPPRLHYEAGQYHRLKAKTPNREVATLFGKITLWRHGDRYVERDVAEPTIFPLEVQLGLVEGATPALAREAARRIAETGATQQTVLAWLKERHGIRWGVKKLRAVTETIAAALFTAAAACNTRKGPLGFWRSIRIRAARRVTMSPASRKLIRQAYHALRTRTRHVQYADFRRQAPRAQPSS
jgi:hypothetical protein